MLDKYKISCYYYLCLPTNTFAALRIELLRSKENIYE